MQAKVWHFQKSHQKQLLKAGAELENRQSNILCEKLTENKSIDRYTSVTQARIAQLLVCWLIKNAKMAKVEMHEILGKPLHHTLGTPHILI